MSARLRKVEGFSPVAAAKLESSGISEDQAAALGMYSVENAATLHPSFNAAPALVIPYYNGEKKPMRAHPAWPDFYRLRYLDVPGAPVGFGDLTEGKKQRYSQPPETGVCAYLPLCVNWKAIQDDPSETVLITEGELKAAKASLEGFPTIGLGGVYNFRSSKAGIFWLTELELFTWARRRVVVCYDSDYSAKPDICSAINALCEELSERGALVELATLPNVYDDADRKTGLDDFLVSRDDEALIAILKEAEPLALTRELWRLNDEVVYVEDPGFVMTQKQGQKLNVAAFNTHSRWATAYVPERKVKPDGSVSNVKTAAAPVWLKWPLRKAVNTLTYKPGQEKFCEDKGEVQYNQWKGWGVEPNKGSVQPWLDLLAFVFEGAEKGALDWFLDWCAYPLQNPGVKMFSAALIWGAAKGTGKTLIFYTLKRIYGVNFIKIKNEDLKDTWWLENKQFILGDEISGNDKRSESDALKAMITQEEVNINIKYVPQFSIPDCANYGFTSNHPDALFLEDGDRRNFIHHCIQATPLPQAFYDAYDKWKDSEEGPAALFHWLLKRDVSKFNPHAPAFQTAARGRMTMMGKSDLATWVTELRESPDTFLRLGQMKYTRDLFTSAELLAMYAQNNDSGQSKVTANGLSRALASAGFTQAYGGQPLAPKGGKPGRYIIVRNVERWAATKHSKDFLKNIEQPPVRS